MFEVGYMVSWKESAGRHTRTYPAEKAGEFISELAAKVRGCTVSEIMAKAILFENVDVKIGGAK